MDLERLKSYFRYATETLKVTPGIAALRLNSDAPESAR
jgi:hypothetical protein